MHLPLGQHLENLLRKDVPDFYSGDVPSGQKTAWAGSCRACGCPMAEPGVHFPIPARALPAGTAQLPAVQPPLSALLPAERS